MRFMKDGSKGKVTRNEYFVLGGGPFDKFNPLTAALSISLNGM